MNLNLPSFPHPRPRLLHRPTARQPAHHLRRTRRTRAASSTSGSSSRGRSVCPWPAAKRSSASTSTTSRSPMSKPPSATSSVSCTGSAGIRSTPTSSPSRPGSATTATSPCPSPAPPASSSKPAPRETTPTFKSTGTAIPARPCTSRAASAPAGAAKMPTQRYGEDYLMLDADGPGQLLGFVYGVRLLDDTDRWSHGGAENIYIDGHGEHPVFLRGIGGEDTFGSGYGGALHPPETHHYAAMPYYLHEDVGEARPAQRLVGYRFFEKDTLPFRQLDSHALRLHGQRHLLHRLLVPAGRSRAPSSPCRTGRSCCPASSFRAAPMTSPCPRAANGGCAAPSPITTARPWPRRCRRRPPSSRTHKL